MTRAVVTGAAGFIGSHLCERLVADGLAVTGVDSFTDYYPRAQKEANLAAVRASAEMPGASGASGAPGASGAGSFTFIEADLVTTDVDGLLGDAAYVFHLAAQPGVRASWGEYFRHYVDDNIMATQRLLEAVKGSPTLERFIFASSSSVYGDACVLPAPEDSPCRPISPYGVTKLAAEHLCRLYAKSFDVPTVSLRYFTVYGPRQRPDMAFHRFARAALAGEAVHVYGDGAQTRDVTYVADAVAATVAATRAGVPGGVFNVGGGSAVSINDVLDIIEELAGRPLERVHEPAQPGDPQDTASDCTAAGQVLGYAPKTAVRDGLAEEVGWMRGQVTEEVSG